MARITGETLFTIARQYETSAAAIRALNEDGNLDWDLLSPGDVVCVPAGDEEEDADTTQIVESEGSTSPTERPLRSSSTMESPNSLEACSVFPSAIVDGVETRPHAWPWQALIGLASSNGSFPQESFCGGVLIGNQTVLTAAHCIVQCIAADVCIINNKNVSGYRVGLGVHKRSKFHTYIGISKVYVHKDYNFHNGHRNDVAILKLERPVRFSKRVQPVRLPSEQFRLCPGAEVVVTGWGGVDAVPEIPDQYSRKAANFSDALRQGKIRVIDSERCRLNYGKVFSSATMICAGTEGGGTDACQGDSGGPLVVFDPLPVGPSNKAQSGYVLVGLVSWGVGCGTAGNSGVYTSIPYLLPWIRQMQRRGRMDGYE
ncbi:putative Plasminogen [Hypsibius exemplaris]|uniref:Plasminogen n=1 Tax=Hypsibius exemplaris TaxID=2072580 RepID=A0A1W0XEG6_HYPEX|nr:putative Plasminogen [Hypsibius exemplaris]